MELLMLTSKSNEDTVKLLKEVCFNKTPEEGQAVYVGCYEGNSNIVISCQVFSPRKEDPYRTEKIELFREMRNGAIPLTKLFLYDMNVEEVSPDLKEVLKKLFRHITDLCIYFDNAREEYAARVIKALNINANMKIGKNMTMIRINKVK